MRSNPEILLISAVIRTGDVMLALRHGVSARLFHTCRDEWEWIEAQWESSKTPPSKASFKARFPEFRIMKSDDLLTTLDLVKKSHARNQLHRFVEETAQLIENGEEDEAVRKLSSSTTNLLYEMEHNADAVDIVDEWHDTFAEVIARSRRAVERGYAGVPTGIPSLDKLTGGLQEGWLAIVGARLGVGKTWSLIRMAYGAALSGFDVLYFSLEQSKHQISMRMQGLAAHDLGYALNPAQLVQGVGLDEAKYRQILDEIQGTIEGKFYVNDVTRGRVSTKTVESAIEAKRPHIVFIDYLTLLSSSSYTGSPWIDVGRLTAELKTIAEQYRIPIVAASQLNRMTGKEPGAENLSQSDSIGQDADLIITLINQTDHVKRMKVVKNRHGPDGVAWPMQFDPSKGIFEEVTGNKAETIMDSDRDED